MDPAPPELYTLSLHDALPISADQPGGNVLGDACRHVGSCRMSRHSRTDVSARARGRQSRLPCGGSALRSEEHTSELQSRVDLVCRLLLEKKKEHAMRARPLRR